MQKKSKRRARKQQMKGGVRRLRWVLGGVVILFVGALVGATWMGVDATPRGVAQHGDACQVTTDCAIGHVCYAHQGSSLQCLRVCRNGGRCPVDHQCTLVVPNPRRRLNTVDLCVRGNDSD